MWWLLRFLSDFTKLTAVLWSFHFILDLRCYHYSILCFGFFNHCVNLFLSDFLLFFDACFLFFLPSHHFTKYITKRIHLAHLSEFVQTFFNNLFVIHSFFSLDFLANLILHLYAFLLEFVVSHLPNKHFINI